MDTLYNGYNKTLVHNSHFLSASIKQVPMSQPATSSSSTSSSAAKSTYFVNSASLNVSRDFQRFRRKSADPLTPQTFTAYEAAFRVDGQDNIDVRPRVKDNITSLTP